MKFSCVVGVLLAGVVVVDAVPPVSVSINYRGQQYPLEGVATVSDLKSKVSDLTSDDDSKSHSLLFKGTNLLKKASADDLSEMGVSDGDVLNLVPKKKSTNKTASPGVVNASSESSSSSNDGTSTSGSPLEEMLKGSGLNMDALKDMASPENMEEQMNMMQEMMNSPMFDEFMNDDTKLEEARQAILNNPIMAQAMKAVPGFSDILNNAALWKETMQAAAQMYKNMSPDDLKGMMGGMMPPGMGGADMGGFGGAGNDLFGSGAASGLDELSED